MMDRKQKCKRRKVRRREVGDSEIHLELEGSRLSCGHIKDLYPFLDSS